MELKIFHILDAPMHFKPKISNRLFNLFSSPSKNDIELTNVAELNSEIKHLIFNLQDVLYSGTKKNGVTKEIPFTQTINVFLSKKNIYIENKGQGYLNNIKDYLSNEYEFKLDEQTISNTLIGKIKKNMDIRILDIYFVDEFGDKLGGLNLLNEFDLFNLPNDIYIDSITFQAFMSQEGYITLHCAGDMLLNLRSVNDFNNWLLFIDKVV